MISNGFRFRVGVSLVLGLIWTSAVLGNDPLFGPAVHYPAENNPNSVAIGDLDGDQAPDLAVANYGTPPDYDNGSLSVLLPVGVLRDLIDLGQDPDTGEHLDLADIEWRRSVSREA